MSRNPCLLGIDLGTSSVKAALVSLAGQIVAAGAAEYPILRPQPGHAEQDPEAWWRAVCWAVREAVSAAGDAVRVLAIGLSGQMHGTVMLDADGALIAPAIIWPDQRSAAQVAEITETLGLETLTAITGSPVATGFQASTLLWVRQERPDLWDRLHLALLPKDYVRWRMTGITATDPSDGSGALLLDVNRRIWSPQMLSLIGLAEGQLPSLQSASADAGRLCAQAAAGMGLPEGTPVVTGAADTACSALGAGVVTSGKLLLTLSSGGQLVQPIDNVRIDAQGRVHTFCSALPPDDGPGWYQMGAILSAGLALRWLRDQVFVLSGDDAYDRISGWAAQSALGANGLLFLPYLAGERTPHMNPLARGLFFGLSAGHGRPELSRAVLEGVTFACYDAYAVLAELGADADTVILAGGGARSSLWRQIVADVFGLPVLPLAASEQSALGAALLAGSGYGLLDLVETASSWAVYGGAVEPDEYRHRQYGELVQLFRETYGNNFALFEKLHRIHSVQGVKA